VLCLIGENKIEIIDFRVQSGELMIFIVFKRQKLERCRKLIWSITSKRIGALIFV